MGEVREDIERSFDEHEPLPDWMKAIIAGAGAVVGARSKRIRQAVASGIANSKRRAFMSSPAYKRHAQREKRLLDEMERMHGRGQKKNNPNATMDDYYRAKAESRRKHSDSLDQAKREWGREMPGDAYDRGLKVGSAAGGLAGAGAGGGGAILANEALKSRRKK